MEIIIYLIVNYADKNTIYDVEKASVNFFYRCFKNIKIMKM